MSSESIDLSINEPVQAGQQSMVSPLQKSRRLAFKDIQEGLSKWRIWLMLAYQDIKLRYRRSILGPFWITLSMAISVYSMGFFV